MADNGGKRVVQVAKDDGKQHSLFREDKNTFRPISYALDTIQSTVAAPLSATTSVLVRRAIKSIVTEAVEGWELDAGKGDEDAFHLKAIAELLRRLDENDAEENDATLIGIRENQLDESRWPKAPGYLPNPLAWLKARALYSYCPADVDLSYAIRHERWMLIMPLLLICPGIAAVVWLPLLLLLLCTVHEPYQLLLAIWSFKTFVFLMWGLVPILLDHLMLYTLLTDTAIGTHASCAAAARSSLPPWAAAVLDAIFGLELTCLCAARARMLAQSSPALHAHRRDFWDLPPDALISHVICRMHACLCTQVHRLDALLRALPQGARVHPPQARGRVGWALHRRHFHRCAHCTTPADLA